MLDNYTGILEQLFAAEFKAMNNPISNDYKNVIPFLNGNYGNKYRIFLTILDYMTQNYLLTDPYTMWEKTRMDSDSIIWNKYIFSGLYGPNGFICQF